MPLIRLSPTSALVSCDGGVGCPLGFSCKPQWGLCLPKASKDTEAPYVLSAAVRPLAAKQGSTIAASVTFSEPLLFPAVISLEVNGVRRPMQRGADGDYSAIISSADAEGPARVVADALDVAGNEGTGLSVGVVALDFSPPSLEAARFVAPRLVGDGGLVLALAERASVQIVATEAVSDAGVVVASSLNANCPPEAFDAEAAVGRFLKFTARTSGQPGCRYQLAWSAAQDVAGNSQATTTALGLSFEVDGRAPAVSNLRVLGVDGGVIERVGHGPFVAQLDVDEPPAFVTLEVGGRREGCAAEHCLAHDGGATCRCPFTVGAGEREGGQVLVAEVFDFGGNSGTASAPVTFDFSGPALVPQTLSIAVQPGPNCPLTDVSTLGLQTTAQVTFTTDEVAVFAFDGGPGVRVVETARAGTALVLRVDALPGVRSGTAQLSAEARDSLGNSSTLALGSLAIDVDAPGAPVLDARALYVRAPWGRTAGQPSFEVLGDAGAWKVGGTWDTPVEGVRLRAVTSRDVRAPNLSELFAAPVTTTLPNFTNPFTRQRAAGASERGRQPQPEARDRQEHDARCRAVEPGMAAGLQRFGGLVQHRAERWHLQPQRPAGGELLLYRPDAVLQRLQLRPDQRHAIRQLPDVQPRLDQDQRLSTSRRATGSSCPTFRVASLRAAWRPTPTSSSPTRASPAPSPTIQRRPELGRHAGLEVPGHPVLGYRSLRLQRSGTLVQRWDVRQPVRHLRRR